jgi:hypothetical protein
VDVAALHADVAEGPPAAADPPGGEPHEQEAAGEPGEDVEEDDLVTRRLRQALAGDHHGVSGRLRCRADGMLSALEHPGSSHLRRAPARHADDLAGDDAAGRARGDESQPDREPVRTPFGLAQPR